MRYEKKLNKNLDKEVLAARLLRELVDKGDLSSAVDSIPDLTMQKSIELLLWAAKQLERDLVTATDGSEQSLLEPAEASAVRTKDENKKVVVYTDGASRGNPGLAGAGAYIVDDQGREVGAFYCFLGRETNNVAEYEGVILGLTKALELGAEKVQLFSDSELLIRQISGRYKVRSAHLRPLFDRVRELLARFKSYKAVHVPREKNSKADALANKAIEARGQR